jgi:hypothetical protein
MRVVVWVVVLVTLALSVSAAAQQPVGSFEDLSSRVRSGDTVYVTDASARETTGTFVKIADATLTYVVDGQVRDITSPDVRQIAKRGDSVMNGFLIGAAIGGALGAAASGTCSDECVRQFPVVVVVLGAALEFGGIGALIDHFIKGRTVVYRAGTRARVQITPLVLAHDRGVRLSFTF